MVQQLEHTLVQRIVPPFITKSTTPTTIYKDTPLVGRGILLLLNYFTSTMDYIISPYYCESHYDRVVIYIITSLESTKLILMIVYPQNKIGILVAFSPTEICYGW